MPELPEVEVICQGLKPRILNKRVTSVICSAKQLRLPIPYAELTNWITNAVITGLKRRGKYLLFEMSNLATLLIHLGMSGKLGLFPTDSLRQKHDHLALVLDNGLELRFNDTRRFGAIQVVEPDGFTTGHHPLAELGPEPFWPEFSSSYLLELADGRKQPVKNLLMDSRVVVGIGNIYASEILFSAGLNPATPIARLTQGQWQTIIDASRNILTQAIACGGSTIADYVNSNGQPGYFQNELKVYGRKDLPCLRCTTPILKTVMAGRATYHCPCCQSGSLPKP